MGCETCNALLAEYKRRVNVFMNEVLKSRGALGPDAKLATGEVDRLQLACQNARVVLMEHWRQDHSSLAAAVEVFSEA